MYEHGLGVECDPYQAVKWYRKAADQGNEISLLSLAEMYYYGERVRQDYTEAYYWYSELANRNDKDAQFQLGIMHSIGLGVDRNYQRAYFWFAISATNSNEKASKKKDEMAEKLSQEQRDRIDTEVEQWLEEHKRGL